MEQSNDVNFVFLNSTETLEPVYHIITLHKLQTDGIYPNLLVWVTGFMSDRYFVRG